MRTLPLREYFLGHVRAEELPTTWLGLTENDACAPAKSDLVQTNDYFEVRRGHLLKLCRDALCSEVPCELLTLVAEYLCYSGHFGWSDDIVGDVIEFWQSPELFGELNEANLRAHEVWLRTGQRPSASE